MPLYVNSPPSAIAGNAVTGAAVALSRATLLLGNTMTTPLGTDFDTGAWHATSGIGTAGTVAASQTAVGGVMTVNSTATASHGSVVYPGGATTPSYLSNGKAQQFYFIARAKIATAGDSVAQMHVGLVDPVNPVPGNTQQIKMGLRGAVDTTHISWQTVDNTNTQTVSGALTNAADNNWHTFEMWNDGTNLNFGYDLGTSVVASAQTASTNIYAGAYTLGFWAFNSTTAAAREIDVDYIYLVMAGN